MVPVSNESQFFAPSSSYTACLYEVALGNADVCVGDLWPTPVRQTLVSFSAPMYQDYFHMITFKGGESGSGHKAAQNETGHDDEGRQANGAATIVDIAGMFRIWCVVPGQEDQSRCDTENMLSWLYIIISLMYAGFVLWVVEGWTNENSFPKKSNVDQIKRTVFNMTASFVGSNDHRYAPHTTAGRVAILTTSFAVLVLTTTYTANMTSNKILDASINAPYSSLDEAVMKRARICGISVMRDLLVPTYPGIEALFVISSTGGAAENFENMEAGKCDIVVTWRTVWELEKKKPINCVRFRVYTLHSQHCNPCTSTIPWFPHTVPFPHSCAKSMCLVRLAHSLTRCFLRPAFSRSPQTEQGDGSQRDSLYGGHPRNF